MAVSSKFERPGVKALMVALNLGLLSTMAMAQDDVAIENSNAEGAPEAKYYAATGAGKTLPEGVMRVRLPFQNVSGEEGYDEEGNREGQGYGININATALAVEYGVTDKLSLAFVVPYITKSAAGLNAYDLRANNRSFQREYMRYKDAVVGLLQQQGMCSDVDSCEALVANPNYSVPAGQEIILTTGEPVTALPNEPTSRQIDRLIAQSVIPLEGETGIGDVELGALYNFYSNDTISLSTGLGLRLPTGKFESVPSGMRETGGGILDLGVRFNFDYQPVPWFVFSLQHQFEQMLASGTKTKSSGIYNDRTNTGDPTTEAAIAIGSDGFDNDQKYEKWGLGHDGFVQLGFGLSDIADVLTPVGVGVNYGWYEDRETRYDGLAFDDNGWRYDEITRLRFVGFNVSFDGLALKPLLPFSLVYDYQKAVSGSFATVAPTISRFQLIGYYKF